MNASSFDKKASPIRNDISAQYIPSLFATNAQSGSSERSSGAQDELERASAAAYAPPGLESPGAAVAAPRRTKEESRVADGGSSALSPSPVSTVDYADIEQKQLELRGAVEQRVRTLESMVSARDAELLGLRAHQQKTEEDYKFNYGLIKERDAALDMATDQLQRLYRELQRATADGDVLARRLEAGEADVAEMKKHVREVETARETAVAQVRKEYAVKEQHLTQTMRARESALEDERQRFHEASMQQLKELEESKAEVEGRTASSTAQMEQHHQQTVRRLEEERDRLQTKAQTADGERADAVAQSARLAEQNSELQQQMELLSQRHRAAIEEAKRTTERLESQVAQTTTLLDKGLATAEDAIREETQKSSRLELENTSLTTRLAEAKSELQQAVSRHAEEMKRGAEERQTAQLNYQAALSSMEETERKWREAERGLRDAVAEKDEELSRLKRRVQLGEQEKLTSERQLEESSAGAARLQQDVSRLTAEVQRWKDEESRTAAKARQDGNAAEERVLALERAVQEGKDELERQRRQAFDQQERSQTEAARLVRELHASEAARRALEDQFHLAQDSNGQAALVNSLRYEKEALERRVVELERTNGEIREQVANFTLELQNDPTVRASREAHRQVQELQQELLNARDDVQRLRDTVAEKDEEIARYQVDILRAQLLLGSGDQASTGIDVLTSLSKAGDAAVAGGLSGSAAALLRQQQQQLRQEWTSMQQRLEKALGRRKKHGERSGEHTRRGHRHRRTAAASSSTTSSSRSSRSSSSSSDEAARHRSRSRGRRAQKETTELPSSAPPPLPPPRSGANASDAEGAVRHSFLLQEAEVWRQKCMQLEQHLRTVFHERDQLRRELELSKQDIVALGSEKQSLLDLNALLKAQLREAYRSSFESFGRAAATGSSTAPGRPQPHAEAPLLRPPARLSPATQSPAPSRRAALAARGGREGSVGTGARSPVSPQGWTDDVASAASSSHARPLEAEFSSSERRQQPSQQDTRLAAVEEEIRHVRAQISSTMRRQAPKDETPVVRKGGAAVRHYGWH